MRFAWPVALQLKSFFLRVGGMMVAPRDTLTTLARGGKGGLTDLMLLLFMQVVAVQLPILVRTVFTMVEVSYAAGISSLLNVVAGSMVMQLVGVLVATVIMGWFTRGFQTHVRNLDLAALCMIPAVCVQLSMSLAAWTLRFKPGQTVALAVVVAGALWFAGLIVYTIKMLIAEEKRGSDG